MSSAAALRVLGTSSVTAALIRSLFQTAVDIVVIVDVD